MHYLIYKITNVINSKSYIGCHKTGLIDDGYMGSGKILKHAFEKHGIENFTKEVLFIFDNEIEMFAKEAELVNEEYVQMANTYNLKKGGSGGFDYINRNKLSCFHNVSNAQSASKKAKPVLAAKYGDDWAKIIGSTGGKTSAPIRAKLQVGIYDPANKGLANAASLLPESRIKRKQTYATIGHQQGEKNSQFGTCWVTNGSENKKINKNDLDNFLLLGYSLGRKVFKN